MSNKNCIPSCIIDEIMTDIGETSRGKYTLPKIPALLKKVADVPFKQAAK